MPTRLCTVHQGTVKQRVQKLFEGVLSGLGKKLQGIFR